MRGEEYFLVLIGKDGQIYRVFRKPVTLRKIDEQTVHYQNRRDLVKTIIERTGTYINPKDISKVQIWRQPNSKKEEYKLERGPLYKKDASVLNADATASKFELLAMDKDFVIEFVERYSKVRNFKNLSEEVKADIRNGVNYGEPLQELAEKVFSTYKGARNVYLAIESYKNKKNTSKKSNLKDSGKDSIEYDKDLTKEEFEEVKLSYLMEHERELLDIEDFNNHEDMSCFDAHRSK